MCLFPESLTTTQQEEAQAILRSYSNAFSDVPGFFQEHLVQHEIITEGSQPVTHRAYRTPHALREKVQDELQSMLDMGIIELISSAYASPIISLRKSQDQIRVVTDFRSLNKMTEFDPYAMPRIDEILDDVANAKFISTLDLTKGFYQVPLDEKTKEKSSFVTPFGRFCYYVLCYKASNR